MTRSGYFFGKLVQNTPDGTTDSNWIIEVQAFDNNTGWTFQRAARSSDKAIFTRIQDNGTWSDWEVLARKSDLQYGRLYCKYFGGGEQTKFSMLCGDPYQPVFLIGNTDNVLSMVQPGNGTAFVSNFGAGIVTVASVSQSAFNFILPRTYIRVMALSYRDFSVSES